MQPYQLNHFRYGLVFEMRNAPPRAHARGPDEPQRYQTDDLNAYDTLYRPSCLTTQAAAPLRCRSSRQRSTRGRGPEFRSDHSRRVAVRS